MCIRDRFLVSAMGKLSANTLYSPSFLRFSGGVSSCKKSLNDFNCTSRKSGYSSGDVYKRQFHYYVTTHRKVRGTDKFAIFSHDVRCRHFRLVLRLNDDDFADVYKRQAL